MCAVCNLFRIRALLFYRGLVQALSRCIFFVDLLFFVIVGRICDPFMEVVEEICLSFT